MNTEITTKLNELSADKEFLKELFELDSPEKIQAKFAEKGVELSLEEVKAIITGVVDAAEKKSGEELDETALDGVAGGFAITAAIGWGVMALMAVGGFAIGWSAAKGKC